MTNLDATSVLVANGAAPSLQAAALISPHRMSSDPELLSASNQQRASAALKVLNAIVDDRPTLTLRLLKNHPDKLFTASFTDILGDSQPKSPSEGLRSSRLTASLPPSMPATDERGLEFENVTALHLAIWFHRDRVVLHLLQAGADPSLMLSRMRLFSISRTGVYDFDATTAVMNSDAFALANRSGYQASILRSQQLRVRASQVLQVALLDERSVSSASLPTFSSPGTLPPDPTSTNDVTPAAEPTPRKHRKRFQLRKKRKNSERHKSVSFAEGVDHATSHAILERDLQARLISS